MPAASKLSEPETAIPAKGLTTSSASTTRNMRREPLPTRRAARHGSRDAFGLLPRLAALGVEARPAAGGLGAVFLGHGRGSFLGPTAATGAGEASNAPPAQTIMNYINLRELGPESLLASMRSSGTSLATLAEGMVAEGVRACQSFW